MIDLFAPAANDQSIVFLHSIFGSMNGVIQPPGVGFDVSADASSGIGLLGTMFKTFNSVILAVGALVVVYMTVVGVMKTAHEGQFMGRNWNSLWLPIRTVLGIAALVPTGSGFSGIQIVMMWVILQGVGAADTLWTSALNYIDLAGNPNGKLSLTSTQAKMNIKSLFQGVMCLKSAQSALPNPGLVFSGEDPEQDLTAEDGAYYCAVNKQAFCRDTTLALPAGQAQSKLDLGIDGSCGTLEYCNEQKACSAKPDSLQCLACKAQKGALATMVPLMGTAAELYVATDYEYRVYYNKSDDDSPPRIPSWVQQYCNDAGLTQCTQAGGLPSPVSNNDWSSAPGTTIEKIYWKYKLQPILGSDFYSTIMGFYTEAMDAMMTSYMSTQPTDAQSNPQLQEASQLGWIFAGSYYHIIARNNKSNLQAVNPELLFYYMDQKSPESPIQQDNPMSGYRNNYCAANSLISIASGQGPGGSCAGGAGQIAAISGSAGGDVMATFGQLTSPSTDSNPINQLSIAGYTMLMVAQIVFLGIMIAIIIMAVTGDTNIYVLGTGVGNPLSGAAMAMMLVVMPLVFLVLGILVTVGATLAIYVPLIPYLLFTMGALNWLLLTVEAMVAGPLVALGILSPSGQHDILGAAENGMWLLFSIFLRPSLMIFGMIAGMLMASVAVAMVNMGFSRVSLSLFDFAQTGGSAGGGAALAFNPLAAIFVLVFYVTLIITVLNKCFSAIHVVPDNVMKWLGKQAATTGGEAEAAQGMKSAISGASGQASSQMSSGLHKAGEVASSQQSQKDKAAAEAKGKLDAENKGDDKTA